MVTYLAQNAGWDMSIFSVRSNAFGHAVLTNVGSLNLESGFAPLPPMIHC